MKGEIYEFDPVIYPMRLWVSVCPDYDKADETFYFLNEQGEVVDDTHGVFDSISSAVANTFCVAHKESAWKGCLVNIWRSKECGCGVCAHEASHVVDWVDDEFGLGGHSFSDGEPRAYLIQWAANCIDKVLRGKV